MFFFILNKILKKKIFFFKKIFFSKILFSLKFLFLLLKKRLYLFFISNKKLLSFSLYSFIYLNLSIYKKNFIILLYNNIIKFFLYIDKFRYIKEYKEKDNNFLLEIKKRYNLFFNNKNKNFKENKILEKNTNNNIFFLICYNFLYKFLKKGKLIKLTNKIFFNFTFFNKIFNKYFLIKFLNIFFLKKNIYIKLYKKYKNIIYKDKLLFINYLEKKIKQ
jgi:hypothetical protein